VTTDTEMHRNDREKVLEVFTRELPYTARILSPPVVTEEIVFGPDYDTPDDDEVPPKEWYDRHLRVMDELVGEGILQTGQVMGMGVYGLTVPFQEAYEENVLHYLMQKAKLLRDRAEDQAGPGAQELLRRAEIMDRARRSWADEPPNAPTHSPGLSLFTGRAGATPIFTLHRPNITLHRPNSAKKGATGS
jgi:hypothetical protein